MYEIVMSNGDSAECDSVAACLTAAATMAEDSGWESSVDRVRTPTSPTPLFAASLDDVLNQHIVESKP